MIPLNDPDDTPSIALNDPDGTPSIALNDPDDTPSIALNDPLKIRPYTSSIQYYEGNDNQSLTNDTI